MALKRGKGRKGHVACTRCSAVDWLEGQGTGYKGLTELTTGELFLFLLACPGRPGFEDGIERKVQ